MVPNTNNHQSVLQSALASNRLGPKVAKNRRKVPKSSQIGQKSSTKGLEIGQKVRIKQQTVDVHEGKEADMSKEKKSKKKKKHLNVFESNDIDVHKKEKAQKCSTKGLDISQKVSLKQQEAEMSKDKKFKKKKNCLICEKHVKKSRSKHNVAV